MLLERDEATAYSLSQSVDAWQRVLEGGLSSCSDPDRSVLASRQIRTTVFVNQELEEQSTSTSSEKQVRRTWFFDLFHKRM